MRKRLVLTCLALILALSLALAVSPAPAETGATAGKGFSIAAVEPDALAALQAKGVKFKYPFPNMANKGKKFNPQGDTVLPLVTAAEQKVLVIFVEFEDTPPGAPETRLELGDYFDAMLFGEVYDPPEYAAYPGHPTDRTLKNYYDEVSYGQVEITTLNLPGDMGWAESGHEYGYYCTADGVHDNSFGPYPRNAQGLVVDAVNAVDDYVDFSAYAVDGAVPNLFVVYARFTGAWLFRPGH